MDGSSSRRSFLKTLGLAGAGLLAGSRLSAEGISTPQVPRRKFGRHDLTVSALCLGGYALRVAQDAEAQKIVDGALEAGIDFFDNCWDYHGGRAEELMGRCIKGRRDKVFLMTKVCSHTGGGKKRALEMLEESLARLGTDYLDLWQVHAVSSKKQVDEAFAAGGVIEALDAARRQGLVRYVGFTGHTSPDVHLDMLTRGYAFDACQYPVSPVEASSDAFIRRVLPECRKQGIASLGMKIFGGNGRPLQDRIYTAKEGMDYALSLPITSAVCGITSLAEFREDSALAAAFRPLPPEALTALEERCRPANTSRRYEPYRHWLSYRDGDAIRAAHRV